MPQTARVAAQVILSVHEQLGFSESVFKLKHVSLIEEDALSPQRWQRLWAHSHMRERLEERANLLDEQAHNLANLRLTRSTHVPHLTPCARRTASDVGRCAGVASAPRYLEVEISRLIPSTRLVRDALCSASPAEVLLASARQLATFERGVEADMERAAKPVDSAASEAGAPAASPTAAAASPTAAA
eukprot:4637433-Pleurochrysis_carterae.AAC.1